MTTPLQICQTIVQWLNQPAPHPPDWSPTTWESFKFICRVHGVAPLLHKKLSGVEWLDRPLTRWLAEQHRFNRQRLAKMQAELKEILARFHQEDIPVMPLKGSLLAVKFYNEAGLRPMADLDLLIRLDDFERSATLLAQLGYEPDVVHWKHTGFIKADNRRVVSTACEHPDNPRGLEIHLYCRETFGGPTVELTSIMWQNAAGGDLLGEPAMIPRPEVLWLHLLVHTTYHMWQGKGRLIHLVDLARLASHLDDPRLWLNSIEARYTYPALAMLKKYFPAAVDDSLLPALQARLSPAFRRWVAGLDLVNTSPLNPKPPGLYLLKALKFSEGRLPEVGQALRFAFWPRLEEIALDHPKLAKSKMPWLAYLLLPWDWVKRVGRPGRRTAEN